MTNAIKNRLICGDNFEELKQIEKGSVDLIYIDPPFFTNRHYEVIWGDEAEIRSFKDRWEGGIEHYISWLKDRVEVMHDALKSSGSFYLHCDWHASAHIRIMLDKIFGEGNFRSEIIWKRSNAHSDSKQGRTQYGQIHDTIYFYTKTDAWFWNPVYTPYDQAYIDNFYKYTDPETGRRYRMGDLSAAKPGGDTQYEWRVKRKVGSRDWQSDLKDEWKTPKTEWEYKGIPPYKGRSWAYSKTNMIEYAKSGRICYAGTGTPCYKRYLDEMPGVPLQDLWTDIGPIGAKAAERLGYPTQKPESLLDRIIETSCPKKGIVLDAFCGCGTACVSAHKLGRHWIGIDISPTAIKVMQKRLLSQHIHKDTDYTVTGTPKTIAALKKLDPFEFENWAVDELHGWHSKKQRGDMGLDGYIRPDMYHKAAGIQVKQSENIGRNVVDNFKAALERADYTKGFIIAFSFGKGAVEEAARLKNDQSIDIRLVTVEDILAQKADLT